RMSQLQKSSPKFSASSKPHQTENSRACDDSVFGSSRCSRRLGGQFVPSPFFLRDLGDFVVRISPYFCNYLVCLLAATAAWAQQAPVFSVPPADAPELAAPGKWPVGVRTIELVHAAQPDILRFDAATGKAPLTDRKLTIEIW